MIHVVGGSKGGDCLPYSIPGVRHEFDALDGIALGNADYDGFLNVTRSEGGSSLLMPDLEQVRDWKYNNSPFVNDLEVVKRIPVRVIRLDNWCIKHSIQPDFISLNIQGGELDALIGATGILRGVLGLQLEVAFVPYYIGQPSFGTIFTWLHHKGFEFNAILTQNKISRMTREVDQVFEAHCLWLRKGSTEALDLAAQVYH